ncbi:MAG: hypothetical protein WC399_02415 [Bacilli bacterium]|jgi:hypothetical protein
MTPWKNLTPERKSLYIGLVVYAVGIVVFVPFAFFGGWYYLLTGWLLGMVINLINYALINYQSHMLKNVALGQSSKGALLPLMYMLRFGLYIGGMVLVGVLHNNGLDYFNIFTTFGAYLVISAVIFLSGFAAKKPGTPKL